MEFSQGVLKASALAAFIRSHEYRLVSNCRIKAIAPLIRLQCPGLLEKVNHDICSGKLGAVELSSLFLLRDVDHHIR
jgi:hypothetical protein